MDGGLLNRHGAPLAVLDSGLRGGAENLAIDRRLLARHQAGACPDLLRFYRSRPTACVGRHQAIDRELRLGWCRARGIETARRITGGGALYLDPGQLGLSLLLRPDPAPDLAAALERFCRALGRGLARLGIAARFKAPNDLELDGRKLASAFAARAGNSLLLQGTVLLQADVRAMLEALRVPTEKLSPDGLASARERVSGLDRALGYVPEPARIAAALEGAVAAEFGLAGQAAAPGLAEELTGAWDAAEEEERAFAHLTDWRDAGGAEAVHRTPGGVLRARLRLDPDRRRLAAVAFAGDLHLHPADLLQRLAAELTGLHPRLAVPTVGALLRRLRPELSGFGAADLARVLHLALETATLEGELGETGGRLMLYAPDDAWGAADILRRAEAVLVPYCAKPAWCKWRHRDGCPECGRCEVGEAYRLARERAMPVVTVTDYEHLVSTLAALSEGGARAYLGMCCGSFFLKRQRAFQEAGMPAVLMDVAGANCYELKQEDAAYAGRFRAEARIDAELLRRVMDRVPGGGAKDPANQLGKDRTL